MHFKCMHCTHEKGTSIKTALLKKHHGVQMFVGKELSFETSNYEVIVLLSKPMLETELRI